jgi:hypothetical protein
MQRLLFLLILTKTRNEQQSSEINRNARKATQFIESRNVKCSNSLGREEKTLFTNDQWSRIYLLHP